MSLEACWLQSILRFFLHSQVQFMNRLSALTGAVATACCYSSSYSMIFHQFLSLHSDMHAVHWITYGVKPPSLSSGKSLIFLASICFAPGVPPAFALHSVYVQNTKMLGWPELPSHTNCYIHFGMGHLFERTGIKSLFLSQTSPFCLGGCPSYQWSPWLLFPRLPLSSCWREKSKSRHRKEKLGGLS